MGSLGQKFSESQNSIVYIYLRPHMVPSESCTGVLISSIRQEFISVLSQIILSPMRISKYATLFQYLLSLYTVYLLGIWGIISEIEDLLVRVS